AISFHYSKPENGENSETDRMVQGVFDLQTEFPEEKIITPIQVIDNEGQLTTEIKDMLTSLRDRYESVKKTFKTNPVPIYFLEETFHRSFANEISFRNDPDFTIEFNAVDDASIAELKKHFEETTGFV